MRIVLWAAVFGWVAACSGDGNKPAADDTGGGPGPTGDTDGGDDTDGGNDVEAACTSWVGTFDLTGSRFAIDAMMDFQIELQTPYDDADTMGPGALELRFTDDGGAPGEGLVTMNNYMLRQDFITGVPGVAEVHTELDNTASDPCGVARGSLTGNTLIWKPAEVAPYCRDGQISCTGNLCGSAGSPPDDKPFVFDGDCSENLPLGTFTFEAGGAFEAEGVQVSKDADQTTFLQLQGSQEDLVEDADTPACLCP